MAEPQQKKSKSLQIGYWSIRGLAQPIRLLLKYAGIEFENVTYTQAEAPSFSREGWLSVKHTLGLPFPNLPYLIDGDVKITQTNAILTYLGRKANLYGKTEADMATVDMLLNVAMDFRNGFVRLCYSSQMESMKEEYLKTVRAKLEEMSKYLGDKPWFAGNEITFPDFHFYEMFDQHKEFHPQLFDGLDNLKAYMDRFEALPAIKSYMDSPEFIRWPINNPIAQWRGNKKL
ncbi:PREDICTED: glutathione S-transferase Mu 3-like [Amphimedon queenslandica]|uniref:glutathione transferase n=1 Tax=Amphimedon queenslandica TaxID=400682 RepID=A0A1X7USE6_AMPQE|nr:PREDICTED: glutathione S-transferase Mu 3-like [Amphimedon queenslandica]|eukprot:XP_003386865.1 PREDICTED: glutathione S-transferase Mu 3-like [Amphimedon queenslandica]